MVLTPWETLSGDILVEFWNSDAVLVARNCPDGTRPVHVGRSGLSTMKESCNGMLRPTEASWGSHSVYHLMRLSVFWT